MRNTPTPRLTFLVWIIGLILVVWFGTLDARHLLRSDEGRYAEIAREMFTSGDAVTIRYNGLKYFEKPPLHLWLTALSYEVFGLGDWQARLWSALAGALAAGAAMLAADRCFGRRVALLTGLVLVAAPGFNLGSHFNSLDISVTAFMSCTLAAFMVAQSTPNPARRRRWMLAAWVAMALAVLSKGLIGLVLPGLALLVYSLVGRDWGLWRRLDWLPGLCVFAVVAAPWFVIVSWRNPEFPQFFFIHEHWDRYTSGVHKREAPVWYFLPQLLAGCLPWLALAGRMPAAVGREAPGFKPRLLLLVWVASIVGFFSFSDSKLPGYVLPVYPALATLFALALDRLSPAAWRRQLAWMGGLALLGLVACPFLPRFGSANIPAELYRHYAWWLGACFAVGGAGTLSAWRMNRGTTAALAPLGSITAAALGWFLAFTLAIVGHENFGRPASGADLVPAIQKVLTPDMPIYSVRLLDHTLPFYLRRTTIMVEEPDELEFGTRREPEKWVPTLAEFESNWARGPHALALMSHATFAQLQRDGLRMWPVAEDARRVVVMNFEAPAR